MSNMVASVSARSMSTASRQDHDHIDVLPPYSNEHHGFPLTESQTASTNSHDASPKRTFVSTRSPNSVVKIEALPTIETPPDSDFSRKSRIHEFSRRLHKWPWWWETCACIGSLASFLATAGLLIGFQGKSQPEWPYGITLNSAVSWLSTITKSFLLVPSTACISQSIWISYSTKSQSLDRLRIYDSASRGPWGSLELLWALKARRLACMGALLIVLAVGIDPTVQQTVTVRTRMINSEESATLPYAQTYLEYDEVIDRNGTLRRRPVPSIDIAGAMYSGLFKRTQEPQTTNTQQDVTPSCPTGNCTFPAFHSLAVCNRCDNITDSVVKSCNDSIEENSLLSPFIRYQNCSFALPNGMAIYLTRITDYTANNSQIPAGNMPSLVANSYLEPVISSDPYIPLLTMIILRGQSSIYGSEADMTYEANQCSLTWCLQKYEASVYKGQFAETIVNSSPGILEYNSSWEVMSITPSQAANLTQNPRFLVSSAATRGITEWLRELLTFHDHKHLAISRNYTRDTIKSSTSAQIAGSLRLFQQGNLKDIFSTLAKSMTTHIRSINSSQQNTDVALQQTLRNGTSFPWPMTNVQPALGTAYKVHVYVDIRWEWLIFTGAILVSTICFFVLVIFQSTKEDVVIWKESPLALLFHGLRLEDKNDANGPVDLRGMESKAKQIRVRLRNGDSGIKLEQSG